MNWKHSFMSFRAAVAWLSSSDNTMWQGMAGSGPFSAVIGLRWRSWVSKGYSMKASRWVGARASLGCAYGLAWGYQDIKGMRKPNKLELPSSWRTRWCASEPGVAPQQHVCTVCFIALNVYFPACSVLSFAACYMCHVN